MKKIFTLMLMAMALNASAQKYIRIWQGGKSDRIAAQDIVYSNAGANITAAGVTYATSEVDSITIVKTVKIEFNGATATVDKGIADELDVVIEGANVTITNPNVSEEMEFEVSGTSANGSFNYYGSYKCKFFVDGLTLSSSQGAPFNIQCGKRIEMILAEGTTTTLIDSSNGTQKGCLACRGHLELSGGGNLVVTGNTRHGIDTNEYLILREDMGTVTIRSAVNDGIHAGQYFMMEGGTLNISGYGTDGIQAAVTNDPTEEYNGQIFIKGGTINVESAAPDSKGIKSDSLITITGGTIDIIASGDGSKGIAGGTSLIINEDDATTNIKVLASGNRYEDPVTEETSRCMGIRVRNDLTVTAGTVYVKNTGSGSKGIKVEGIYYAKGGDVDASVDASAVQK